MLCDYWNGPIPGWFRCSESTGSPKGPGADDGRQGLFEACDETGFGPTFGVFDLDKEDCVGNRIRPPNDYSRKETWQRGLDPSQVKAASGSGTVSLHS